MQKQISVLWVAGCVALLSVACSRPSISGQWVDGADQTITISRQGAALDSVKVDANQNFRFTRLPADRSVAQLSLGQMTAPLFLSETPMKIRIETDDMAIPHYTLESGDEEQQAMAQAADMLYRVKRLHRGIEKTFSDTTLHSREDFEKIFTEFSLQSKTLSDGVDALIDTISQRMAALVLIEDYYLTPSGNLQRAKQKFDRVSDPVRNSEYGQQVGAELQRHLDVNVGGQAPDVALPSPAGDTLRLSALKGKWVILDFWASWCGPCMEEMPNLKQIYAKYKDSNLEIFGVSSDTKADNWMQAIAEQKLAWQQVSGLGADAAKAVRRLYLVDGIPCILVINPQGEIVARDLRGEELMRFISERVG